MTPQELREMASFYMKRPAVAGRDPLITEMSAGECKNIAMALHAAADEIDKAVAVRRAILTALNAVKY